jgi:ribosomal protein L5
MRPKQEETKKRYSVRLSDIEYYRLVIDGKGNFSTGIRKAIEFYFKQVKLDKTKKVK